MIHCSAYGNDLDNSLLTDTEQRLIPCSLEENNMGLPQFPSLHHRMIHCFELDKTEDPVLDKTKRRFSTSFACCLKLHSLDCACA